MRLFRIEIIFWFLISSTIGDDGNLEQKHTKIHHLRVVTGDFPPTIRVHRDSNGKVTGFSGLLYEEIDWLSKRLHFTYNITVAHENTSGIKINGTWIGLIGELVKGNADLALGPFAISIQRYEAIDFVGLITGDYTTLLVKYPREAITNPWSALKPFTVETWIGLIISTIVVLCSFAFLVFIRTKMGQNSSKVHTVGDLTIYVVATITAQGESYRTGHRSFGIIAAFWCFLAFVMVNSYSTTLVSYLSVHYKAPDINSMSQLAASDTYEMISLRGSYMETDILNSSSGTFKLLGDKLRKCGKCRLDSLPDIGQKVLNEDSAGLLTSSIVKALMQLYNRPKGYCRLTMANVRYNWKHMYFAATKSSYFYEDVTREMFRVHEYGFFVPWRKEELDHNPHRCLLQYNNDGFEAVESSFRLKLNQVAAPFYILLIGYVIGFLAFICEKKNCFHGKLGKGGN